MRIEPRLAPPLIPTLREFGRAPVDLVPKETLYIDVSHSDDAMLVPMKEKGRYNIRLSEREGVKLATDTTGRTISHFHSILTEASQRDSFGLESLLFFEDLASVLCGYGHAKILYAEHEGDALGTLLLVTYGSRATYLYGGITNTKRNLMGGYALQWAAMKMARDAGCTIYDFYGFDQFRAPENNYAKFSQFKSQFGGIVAKFVGAQDYFFLDNLVDAFIKVAGEIQPEQQPAGATK
jgi:lipid II:glycine glycyltransferase (peptidoglycan interpeptide bridge formation enzyme)